MGDVRTLTAVDFYNRLLPLEAGEQPKKEDQKVATEMKEFLLCLLYTSPSPRDVP